MDRCTGRRDITEILLKKVLNTIQSINLRNDWLVGCIGVNATLTAKVISMQSVMHMCLPQLGIKLTTTWLCVRHAHH